MLLVVVFLLYIPGCCHNLWFVHSQPFIRNASLSYAELGVLLLENVQLTGTIPTELGRLTELGEFVLYGCNYATGLCPCRCADLLFDSHKSVLDSHPLPD